ncbi:MAG: anhydro-N-acetylmuramic acid kinase [Gammaproteobacteria bacterium]|nr:anhydro-N-acetylmuramic acid kinase [Gammaproteobacteria bacterium]MBQ0840955.1 anhydro-N-acetylmuramic acid kinase [Gammaproteobacteria bacterium]
MNQPPRELYIGLMSGTSMDGIDSAIVDFSQNKTRVIATYCQPIPEQLQQAIKPLFLPGDDGIDALGSADQQLGVYFAAAATALLEQAGLKARDISAIGSHGQTVRHRPPSSDTPHPFTLQIGDPNIIAARTGITTVADFRRRDMALGGQAAPLVPAFHHAVFHSKTRNRAVVNIGGISNITLLTTEGEVLGFDTGPGNRLLDDWIKQHKNKSFDDCGQWADQHASDPPLLEQLKTHPFLRRPAPKSTGREEFNRQWLDQALKKFDHLSPGCVQATLLAFTAETIADALKALPVKIDETFICGGGALNTALMKSLGDLLAPAAVGSTAELGISPEWVEAAAFAWLARQTLAGLAGNLPAVTGAKNLTILGGIYPSYPA